MIQSSALAGDKFLVRAPNRYEPERRYVLDVVLSEWLGFGYDLALGDDGPMSIQLAGDPDRRALTLPDGLFKTESEVWLTARSMPSLPLAHVDPGEPAPAGLPVMFGTADTRGRPWHNTETGLAFTFDLFGSIFFFLTRYEELVRGDRDPHGRFPAFASLAMAERFLDRPVVDEYVDVLWQSMRSLWPTLQRRQTNFRLRLTHDVDQPWATLGQPVGDVAHALVGDVIVRRDSHLAVRRFQSFVWAQRRRPDGDPYDTFDLLMATSERHGLRSVFYFLADNQGRAFDGRYRLSDPPVAALIRRIHERGHEIGLHASYRSYDSAELTRIEFETLRASCRSLGIEQETWGVRQHYLRFENPHTWRNHEAVGLDYDSTLAFADEIGFRAGTCREYPLFDLVARRRMRLRERPLVVMDTTMLEYMGLGAAAAAARAGAIVDACRTHRGDAVLLYHNSLLAGRHQQRQYVDLVAAIAPPANSRQGS